MDFAASGSSTEKAVSEENLYPGQAEVSETSITSIPLSSIFNSCSNSLTVNGLCRHPANPCTVNSSRCMSLRAVTAITGTDCACGMFEARSSFSKSKPLIAGICTSVSRTSKVAVRKASSSSSSCKQETEFIPLCWSMAAVRVSWIRSSSIRRTFFSEEWGTGNEELPFGVAAHPDSSSFILRPSLLTG